MDHAIKLSFITARTAAQQFTAHFTELSQVSCRELCVSIPPAAPVFLHCSSAGLWVKL